MSEKIDRIIEEVKKVAHPHEGSRGAYFIIDESTLREALRHSLAQGGEEKVKEQKTVITDRKCIHVWLINNCIKCGIDKPRP